MAKTPKRPRDPNQLAKFIVDLGAGNPDPVVVKDKTGNPAKAKGGKARAKSLNPEQRSEIASIAASARWKKGS
jgi:hypothetical protein